VLASQARSIDTVRRLHYVVFVHDPIARRGNRCGLNLSIDHHGKVFANLYGHSPQRALYRLRQGRGGNDRGKDKKNEYVAWRIYHLRVARTRFHIEGQVKRRVY
jgi:hypothetical protein